MYFYVLFREDYAPVTLHSIYYHNNIFTHHQKELKLKGGHSVDAIQTNSETCLLKCCRNAFGERNNKSLK